MLSRWPLIDFQEVRLARIVWAYEWRRDSDQESDKNNDRSADGESVPPEPAQSSDSKTDNFATATIRFRLSYCRARNPRNLRYLLIFLDIRHSLPCLPL